MEKDISFITDNGEKYTFQPPTEELIVALSILYMKLGLFKDNLEKSFLLEFLRVSKCQRDVALAIVARCVIPSSTKETRLVAAARELLQELEWEDLASILIVILMYYSRDIEKLSKSGKRWQE